MDSLINQVHELISHNITHNPIVQKFLMLYESPHPKLGIHIMGSSTISSILERSLSNINFEYVEVVHAVQQLYLVEHINNLPIKIRFTRKETYDVGGLILHESSHHVSSKLNLIG